MNKLKAAYNGQSLCFQTTYEELKPKPAEALTAGLAKKIYKITAPGLEYPKNAEIRIRRFRENTDTLLNSLHGLKEI